MSKALLVGAALLLGVAILFFWQGSEGRGTEADARPTFGEGREDSSTGLGEPETPTSRPEEADGTERTLLPEEEAAPKRAGVEAPTASLVVTVTKLGSDEVVADCGVRVGLNEQPPGRTEYIETARTDDAGRCTVQVPVDVQLFVEAGGLFWERERDLGDDKKVIEPLDPNQSVAVRLELPSGVDTDFWGRVVDEETGASLVGAQVSLHQSRITPLPDGLTPDEMDGSELRSLSRYAELTSPVADELVLARSDGNGLFQLRVASWRRSALHALELDGYGPGFFRPEADHVTPEKALVLPMRRAARLIARVTVVGGPALGAGDEVRLTTKTYELALPDSTYISGSDPIWRASLESSDTCALVVPARVPLHATVVVAGEEHHVGTPLTLEPGERREVEWRFGGGTHLVGVLLDQNDAPIARKEIWLANKILAGDATSGEAFFYSGDKRSLFGKAKTDVDGRFEFESVPPGLWWIGPESTGDRTRVRPRDVAPLATVVEVTGDARQEVELRSWRGLVIAGRVEDPTGAPAPGERVRARPIGRKGFAQGQCGEDGTFVIGPLVPGDYEVSTGAFSKHARAEPVTARAGDEDVVLRLREAGKIHGTVFHPELAGPSPASIWISHRGSGGRGGASAKEDGVFTSRPLEPGTYDLAARTDDGYTGVASGVEVRGGEETGPIELRLERGATLTIRYTGPTTYASFTVFLGEVPTAFDGIHTGTSATHTVPAGSLEVRVRTRDGQEKTQAVELSPGEKREVVFEF